MGARSLTICLTRTSPVPKIRIGAVPLGWLCASPIMMLLLMNVSDAMSRLLRRLCSVANYLGKSPAPVHTRACTTLCNWWTIETMMGGTPHRSRISHRRARCMDSCAFVSSVTHMFSGIPCLWSSSCSRRKTNMVSKSSISVGNYTACQGEPRFSQNVHLGGRI